MTVNVSNCLSIIWVDVVFLYPFTALTIAVAKVFVIAVQNTRLLNRNSVEKVDLTSSQALHLGLTVSA